MAMVGMLIPEFKNEVANTRKLLERVPVERGEWKPHAKSRTLLQLASHVADLPSMAARIVTTTEFDASGPRPAKAPIASSADLLAALDSAASAALAALADRSDTELLERWTFRFKGQEVFALPRIAAIRATCISHLIHHRGQLTVYLRLLDVPLPFIYGPTADEDV